jgi:GAF domain-containing protein
MEMDVIVSKAQISELATAIARAQIEVHDDFADELLGGLPSEFKHTVTDRGHLAGEKRLAAARQAVKDAEKWTADRARVDGQLAAIRVKREAEAANFAEKEDLRFAADKATHAAQSHLARQTGQPEPPAPRPVRSFEEAEREQYRSVIS